MCWWTACLSSTPSALLSVKCVPISWSRPSVRFRGTVSTMADATTWRNLCGAPATPPSRDDSLPHMLTVSTGSLTYLLTYYLLNYHSSFFFLYPSLPSFYILLFFILLHHLSSSSFFIILLHPPSSSSFFILLLHPHSSSSFFINLLLPPCAGIDAPRAGYDGYPLPSARVVSAHVHRDEGAHDHAVTIMTVAWGQAIDHDMTLTAETKGEYWP